MTTAPYRSMVEKSSENPVCRQCGRMFQLVTYVLPMFTVVVRSALLYGSETGVFINSCIIIDLIVFTVLLECDWKGYTSGTKVTCMAFGARTKCADHLLILD